MVLKSIIVKRMWYYCQLSVSLYRRKFIPAAATHPHQKLIHIDFCLSILVIEMKPNVNEVIYTDHIVFLYMHVWDESLWTALQCVSSIP